jgi:hypothetical protein
MLFMSVPYISVQVVPSPSIGLEFTPLLEALAEGG